MSWKWGTKETKGAHCSCSIIFLPQHQGKNAAETNTYAKEKIANRILCQVSIWCEWFDDV
jgi:hypothetical protein